MERDMAVTRINHCHLHYSSFNDKELILVICRKSVLIDAFVLNKIIRIIAEMAISPWVKEPIRRFK
jgi:hypothetical protein